MQHRLYASAGVRRCSSDEIEEILSVSRHHLITTLFRGPIEARNFAEWSMGYKPVEGSDIEAVGHVDLSKASLDERLTSELPKIALAMMRQFYRTNHARAVD